MVVALIGAAALVSGAVVDRSAPDPPDCIVYAKELQELAQTYPQVQLEKALKELRFARYEKECGDAGRIATQLHKP